MEAVDEPRAAAAGLDGQAAPEGETPVHLVGLATVDRHETHALFAHPEQGFEAARDQQFAQVGIGPIIGDPAHIVEKPRFCIGAEIRARDLRVREIGHQAAQVVDAVIGHAHGAGGKRGVAAAFVFGRALENNHVGAVAPGRDGRAQRRVAGTDDENVATVGCHLLPLRS